MIGQLSITWYHQNSDDPGEVFSPNPFPSLLVNPDPNENSSGDECSTTVANVHDRVVLYGPIVGDSATYSENSDENYFLAHVITYNAMKADSTIIYQFDSFDADFIAYFTRHDTTNIGKLYLVESLIDRYPDSAMTIIGNIDPDNEIESYLLEHYYRSQEIADRGGDLSASDSAFYLERTVGTSITDGVVYYYGLANLFIEKHPTVASSRIGQQTIIESPQSILESKTDLSVFPNPSTGSVRLKLSDPEMVISIAEIYNSMGEKIISQRIDQNSFQVDMSSFGNGIYFARCKDTKNEYHIKSFYILK